MRNPKIVGGFVRDRNHFEGFECIDALHIIDDHWLIRTYTYIHSNVYTSKYRISGVCPFAEWDCAQVVKPQQMMVSL